MRQLVPRAMQSKMTTDGEHGSSQCNKRQTTETQYVQVSLLHELPICGYRYFIRLARLASGRPGDAARLTTVEINLFS